MVKKKLLRREKAAKGVASLLEVPRKITRGDPGRPKGTFKYRIQGRPVSVFEWRAFQKRRKRQLQQFQSQQVNKLRAKGFSPEQIVQLQQRQISVRALKGRPLVSRNVADDELAFEKHLAETTISPGTEKIMTEVRRTQLKADRDDLQQQRRHRERAMVSGQTSILKTPNIFLKHQMDITGVQEDNILKAPSVFKENPENNLLRQKKLNILQTTEAGNNLFF